MREKGSTVHVGKNNNRFTDTNIEEMYEKIVRTSRVKVVKIPKMSLQDVVGTLMKKSSNNKQLNSTISKMSFGK
jgi:hypothetical protein